MTKPERAVQILEDRRQALIDRRRPVPHALAARLKAARTAALAAGRRK
jgi:hypothetical protein